MRYLLLFAMLLFISFAPGCAKKNTKKNTAANDETAGVTPQPQQSPDSVSKKSKDDGPNWLTDDRWKKDNSGGGDPNPGVSPGKQPWGFQPPQGGWHVDAPGKDQPTQPGTSTPPPQPPPVKPVSERDMLDLQIYIHDASLASGKMPTKLMIYEALITAKSPVAELIKDGSIFLTGATVRDSIWAYESKALTAGGLVVSPNGVETLTAAQLKARLEK